MSVTVRNACLNVVGEGFWGLQWFMVPSGTVLTLLLQEHGASESSLGVLAAIDNSGGLIPQVLAPFVFATHGRLQRQIVLWHLLVMIPCLALIGPLGWLGHGAWVVPCLLLAWAGYIGAIGVVGAVWVEWMARLFGKELRGTVMGLGWGASSALGIAGTQVAGSLMRAVPAPDVYGILYGVAGVVACLSIGTFTLIREPAGGARIDGDAPLVEGENEGESEGEAEAAPAQSAAPAAPAQPAAVRLLVGFRASLSDRGVRNYLIARVLVAAGFAIGPFITVHYLSSAGGGLSAEAIVRAGGVATVGGATGCLLLGRWGDRHGHRMGMLIGLAAQVAGCVALVWLPGLAGLCAVSLASGIAGAAVTIAHNNLLIETCPHRDRLAHLILGNLVAGTVGLLVPLWWGWVANRHGTGPVFAASLALSVVGLAWGMAMVRDPRAASAAGRVAE
jgi:MFS family permease